MDFNCYYKTSPISDFDSFWTKKSSSKEQRTASKQSFIFKIAKPPPPSPRSRFDQRVGDSRKLTARIEGPPVCLDAVVSQYNMQQKEKQKKTFSKRKKMYEVWEKYFAQCGLQLKGQRKVLLFSVCFCYSSKLGRKRRAICFRHYWYEGSEEGKRDVAHKEIKEGCPQCFLSCWTSDQFLLNCCVGNLFASE